MRVLTGEVQCSGGGLAFSASELADRLGISLRHVQRLDAAGKIPSPVRLGRSVRWPVAEVEHWLAAGAPDRKMWDAMKAHNSERRVKYESA
jgi:excisionase family DNA binding protein